MPHNDRDVIGSAHDRKPSIAFDELHASTSEHSIHPNIHNALLQAIQNKHFVTLTLRTPTEASGEPHIYGERGGQPTLMIYNEEADPSWRLIDVRQIEQVKIWLDEHFTKKELPEKFDPDKEHLGSPKE